MTSLSFLAFLYTQFLERFFHKWLLDFIKSLFCIYWGDHIVLLFNLLMWYIILVNLCIFKNPCISRTNPTWQWCLILLTYCYIWFASILLRIFHPCSSVIFTSNFLFFLSFFFFFWYLCLVLELGSPHRIPLEMSFLWKYFRIVHKIRCQCFYKCLIEFNYESIWSWTSVHLKLFNYWFNFITGNFSVHIFYFFLIRLHISKTLSIYSRLFTLLAYSCSY